MRLFAFLAAVLVFCIIFTAPSRGQQCGPNGCGPQSFQGYNYGHSVQRNVPAAYSAVANDSGFNYQRVAVYGPLGGFRGYRWEPVEAAPQATQVQTAIAAATVTKVSTSATGCLCGQACPCPVAANPLEASVKPSAPKLREVTIPAGMGLYQNAAGDLFLLNREAVTASMDVIPASGWKWQAAK